MTIRILEDEPISLAREEHDRLHRAWQAGQSMTTHPQSFESYVRAHKASVKAAIDGVRPILKNWSN